MPSFRTILEFLIYFALVFFIIPIQIDNGTDIRVLFEEYLKKFNKSYPDLQEFERRLEAFQMSLNNIERLNGLNKHHYPVEYGLTKYSDLSPYEFKISYLAHNLIKPLMTPKKIYGKKVKRRVLPEKVDWRLEKAVGEVHDQGSCGSCWAYATVQTIESIYARTHKFVDFSVQEILDCARYGNYGCYGGDICSVLYWMYDTNFTLHAREDYKYSCQGRAQGVQVFDYICDDYVGEEDIILDILAWHGPVAAAVNAQSWQYYVGGVINYHCDGGEEFLNHAVQIVGYDLTARVPYYIVRNSWGVDFGDGGYLYIAMKKNMCGVANEVATVILL